MFNFALCICLVPVKLILLSMKSVAILVERFPAFSGRTKSHDLICIRHTYQNDKICKPVDLLKSNKKQTAMTNMTRQRML